MASRRRLVSFRLSDEEYYALKARSTENGAHSLSEFVRAKVCMMLVEKPEPWEEAVARARLEFGLRAEQLNGLLEQLNVLLRSPHRTRGSIQ